MNAYSAHGFELDYELVEVDGVGVGVTLVPHGAIDGAGAVTPERGADINVMVTHGMVPGLEAKSHEMGEANLHSGMLEGAFDYIALGHYHDFHEHRQNAYYAGATERFGFGEVDSKPGFAVVEIGDGKVSVEHVEIEARKMVDLPKISAREYGRCGAYGGRSGSGPRALIWTTPSSASGPTTCGAVWRAVSSGSCSGTCNGGV